MAKIDKNALCSCGSGLKYKKCCMKKPKEKMKNMLPQLLKNKEFKNIFDEANNNGQYIFSFPPKAPESWLNLTKNELNSHTYYYSICSVEEIERIFNPSNTSDILLKLRADSVLNNIRIHRTFCKRACYVRNSEWELTKQFDDSILQVFKEMLNEEYKHKIDQVHFGTIFTDKPTGYISKTDFGYLTIIPEALSKFLYFMNIGFYPLFNYETTILNQTIREAIMIAMRLMLSSESFDFELDPRGNIPKNVNEDLMTMTTFELLFIIAHEYAHFLLDHLDDTNSTDVNLFDILPSDLNNRPTSHKVYTYSQLKEFDADKFAIEILSGSNQDQKRAILLFSVVVMSYIDIYESLKYIIKPICPSQTHPSPNERREKLMALGEEIWLDVESELVNEIVNFSGDVKKSLINGYRNNSSDFTKYGSIYLSQWKKKFKTDRVDY